MSNIHSELVDSQLHNPKGFATAGSNTVLTKSPTNTLVWDNIPDGFSCGIYQNYDYARWSHASKTWNNATPLTAVINVTNCSGIVGRRLQLDVVVSTPTLPGGTTDPSVWCSAIGSNTQDIMTNLMGQESRIAPASPAFTTIGNPGIGRVYYKWSMTFDVITSIMNSITIKMGSLSTKICDEGESYVLLREFCKVYTPQDLG